MSATNPIQLNETQELLVKEWAKDDRLWTTQETVEFNLQTFARLILKEGISNKQESEVRRCREKNPLTL